MAELLSAKTGVITAAAAALATTAAVIPGVTSNVSSVTGSVTAAVAPVSDQDAARLAEQATFGPTPAVIARIKELGVDGWLDEQFALKTSSYADLSAMAVSNAYCDTKGQGDAYCFRKYRDSLLPAMRFYRNAVQGDDQLRQRVALALFNIMPVSGLKSPDTAALANYQQLMLDNAFGNYATLVKAVVQSGAMGAYLDHVGSTMKAPNENMARELMQLFTMGPNLLYLNGTARRDASGGTIENYSSTDVAEMARALTGWEPARFAGYSLKDNAGINRSAALVANATGYAPGNKSFLGITVGAAATQDQALTAIVNRLVQDRSTAPRISRLLIQSLVKSNPTLGYVERVSQRFRDTNGDLRVTVRAILTDREARNRYTGEGDGKLKDPILLQTAVARLVGMRTDGYAFTVRDAQLGQQFLRAPSIFGDYPPDFPLPGSRTLVSPASKLMTAGTISARHNFVWQWTMGGDNNRPEFTTPAWVPGAAGAREDWSSWEALGDNLDAMIDRINMLMLESAITDEQRAALKKAMTLVTDPKPALRARRRAQTGLYIVASSPQFQIDR